MKRLLCLSLAFFSFISPSYEESRCMPQYELDYQAGLTAQKNADYLTAIQYYLKALNQRSDLFDAWSQLGDCHRFLAKAYLEKAGAAYLKALQYSPDQEETLACQGEYFVMTGQLSKAHRNYQTLKKIGSKKASELKQRLDASLKPAQRVLDKYDP